MAILDLKIQILQQLPMTVVTMKGSSKVATDYTNGNGLLYFDANKAIFNCGIQSKYYNDTYTSTPPSTKIGNDTENICICYQNATYPLQVGNIVINSSSIISLNAPVIQLNGSTLQSQRIGKDKFFNVYESKN